MSPATRYTLRRNTATSIVKILFHFFGIVFWNTSVSGRSAKSIELTECTEQLPTEYHRLYVKSFRQKSRLLIRKAIQKN